MLANTGLETGLQKQIAAGNLDITTLKIKEEVIKPSSDFFQNDTPIMEKGSIIVRPVNVFTSGRRELLDVPLKKSGKAWVVKAFISAEFFTKEWIARESYKKGIVCFCNKDVPDEWTHFEVINVASSGKSAEVIPHVCNETEFIQDYYEMPAPIKHGGVVK